MTVSFGKIEILSTVLLMVLSCYTSALGSGDPNAILKKWNAIMANDILSVSEIEGRTFIARNYNVSSSHQYGFQLTNNSSSDIVLAVGGTVNTNGAANIKVFYGSAAVSTAVSNTGWFQFMNGGSLQASSSWPANNSPVDDITAASDYWRTLTPNGTVTIPGSQPAALKFTCPAGQKLAVFSVTDVQTFENANVQQIELIPDAATETIIINVSSLDGNVNWNNGNMVGNFDNEYWRSRVIWNIYTTTANKCHMGTISCGPNFKGALVSPTAVLTGNSNFDGPVVCKDLNINSEIHLGSSTGWNGNAPCVNPGSVGDKVWIDANKNGLQDSGENGLADVTVKLFDCNNNLLATTATNSGGGYLFSNLPSSTYYVQFALPSGYSFSPSKYGSDTTKDSDADASTGKTACFALAQGQNNLTKDAGLYVLPGSVGDLIWNDANKNGIQDAGEAGISGVTVKLYTCADVLTATATTSSTGVYSFTNITPGSYYIQVTSPSGYSVSSKDQGSDDSKDSDIDPASGKSDCFTVAAGQNDLSRDAGFYACANKIGDFVWHDTNVNGIQDAGEPGIQGVKVELLQSSTVIASTLTDASGKYEFNNLASGAYSVRVASSNYTSGGALYSTTQTKWYATKKNQGSDDSKDSDAGLNESAAVSLSCANDVSTDFGFYCTSIVLTKTANKTTAVPGDTIKYTFTAYNPGDVTLSGGVDFYDQMLNPSGDHWIDHVTPCTPGSSVSVTHSYVVTANNCGTLTNIAWAIGHPIDGSANVQHGDTVSVTVNCAGSVGDKIWNDANRNGIQDAGEAGISNVTVKLFTCADALVSTTTTDANGNYLFSSVNPGSYYIQIAAPAGYTVTSKDQGSDDSKDSDIDPTTGKTACFTLAAAQTDLTRDGGLYVTPASLGDKVWNDVNKNGLQEAGENGIANVTVKLYTCADVLTATTTTDANGLYSFTNIAPGSYYVMMTAPAGMTVTSKDQGSDDAKDSDIDPATGKTECFTLTAGQTDLTRDGGMYATPASLGDKVWNDANKNGVQDAGEDGVANVTVKLFDCANTLISTTTTNSNGIYSFTNVTPGSYYVQFALPSGYAYSPVNAGSDTTKDSDAEQTTGKTNCFVLAPAQNNLTKDAGIYIVPGSIGDFVWNDVNKNGIQDAGETGVADVTVKLFDCSDNLIASTTTNASGVYSFTNINPGNYYVQFSRPNYSFSPVNAGSDSTKDSDVNQATGKTDCFTLAPGQSNLSKDAGIYLTPGSIGDLIWNDVNKNGLQDAGETGIANVTVKLYDCGNNLISTVQSNTNGVYSFTNVTPGSYYVQFTLPSGYSFSPVNAGTDTTKDSDADLTTGKTNCFVLAPGQNNLTKDAGVYFVPVVVPASLGDRVWLDANHNGVQDNGETGISNLTVKLYTCSDTLVQTKATNTQGYYQFTNLNPGSYYVKIALPNGYVFTARDQGSVDSLDSDVDAVTGKTACVTLASAEVNNTIDAGMYINYVTVGDRVWIDANHNGIQDVDESGMAGVTVKLYNCGGTLMGTTVTDNSGYYQFCCNINEGSYYVQFALPSGYAFTSANQGSDTTKDSNADGITGNTACVFVAGGQSNLTLDAGIYQLPVNIGDKVWNDINKNGIQEDGEAGIPNITVKLYTCAGVLTAATMTDANGLYHFTNLSAGSYYVQFTAPSGYAFSPKNQGANVNVDSDVDPVTGKSDCKAFAGGTTDNSIDAGMYYGSTDLKIEKTVSDSVLSCGKDLTYTVKLTNRGPVDAAGITASDKLPEGLIFVSANATQGSYDQITGIWTVGSLANGGSATLTIHVKVDCTSMNNSNIDLGPAKDFNVFVIEDITQPSADTQGKMAVGRNASLSCYSVADQLPASNGTVDVLVVGKKLIYTSGGIYAGNAVYGDSSNLPVSAVSFFSGSVRKDSVINFADARVYLENLSTRLSGYSVNGITEFQWGTVKMTCNHPFLNVFTVNGSDLNTAHTVEINVPNGSAVVVNILGASVNWHGGLFVNGTAMNNVLYNFPQTTALTISGIDVTGSILAPFAAVSYPAGVQHGQMICKSLTGSGQFNLAPFLGNIPANKAIVNVASIVNSSVSDPDLTNNSASAACSFPQDTTGSGSGSGTGTGSWTLTGSLPAGETVTTLESDHLGGIYAGTVNGYIFKTTNDGSTWVRINENMYSGPVWAIKIHSNGSIFAATVTGVYRTSNNGANWLLTDLQYKDVRSLKIDASGIIYAGTWGFGMYVSTDCGLTWTVSNNGLGSHLVITSLTITPNQTVYAGTFDGGIAKSLDHGNSWQFINIGYNYIWALASNSNGDIFAGTYGDGLYRSTNNGSTWTKTYLPVSYVYSLVIDAADNIYASSYSGGVFASSDNGNTWVNKGMGGTGLSSILVVPSMRVMYSGTVSGKIFRKTNDLTAVNENRNSAPVSLRLDQNYPNPFNPSTRITFALIKTQHVSVVVYNVLGQAVRILADGEFPAGVHEVNFDAGSLASGIYIYKMQTADQSFTRKMILQK